jgi:alkylated DNA repair dioxygenase AlkB
MFQGELFDRPGSGSPAPGFERLDLPDADVRLCQAFLPRNTSSQAFEELRNDVDWEQETYVMYGREVPSPRLTAWYGDPGSVYNYSGVRHDATPWTRAPMLAQLRTRVQEATGAQFNSVLLNYYRDGRDSVSWHSDDETDLGARPIIASLSLGAPRVFQFKHRDRSDLDRIDLELQPGSLLMMAGDTQRYWRHQIPKRKKLRAGRINLTFRLVR